MKTQVCLDLQTKHPFWSIQCWSPHFSLYGKEIRISSTPGWDYTWESTLRRTWHRGQRPKCLLNQWFKKPSTSVLSILLYGAIFKYWKKNLYLCGCNTLVADITQQFHSVSWISLPSLSPSSSLPPLSLLHGSPSKAFFIHPPAPSKKKKGAEDGSHYKGSMNKVSHSAGEAKS